MTIFADQFAAIPGAKANSVATCIGGHSPSDLHLINGLFDCPCLYVPVLAFAPGAGDRYGRAGIHCRPQA